MAADSIAATKLYAVTVAIDKINYFQLTAAPLWQDI